MSQSKINNPKNIKPGSSTLIHFQSKRICFTLEIIALLLSFVSLLIQVLVYLDDSTKASWFIPWLDVDHELSLPSIYSTLLFFFISLLFILIGLAAIQNNDRFRWHWIFIGLIFVYLGFDEGASIHELMTGPMNRALANLAIPGLGIDAWVVPGIILISLVGFAYLKFYLALPGKTKVLLIIAALIYFGGLMGMEVIGATYAAEHGIKNLTYNLFVTLEEFLEMSGLVFAIYSILDYIGLSLGSLRIKLA